MADRSLEVLRENAGGEVVSARIHSMNIAVGNVIESLNRQFRPEAKSRQEYTKVHVASKDVIARQVKTIRDSERDIIAEDAQRLDQVQAQAAHMQEAYNMLDSAYENQPPEEIDYDFEQAA
jgi:hypothetical protein